MKKSAEERKWQIQGFMLCKQTQQGVPQTTSVYCISFMVTRTCSKQNIRARPICSDFVMSLQIGFLSVLMSIFLSIFCLLFVDSILMICKYQVVTFSDQSLGYSPLLKFIQKRNRPEKYPFITTPNLNVVAVRWSLKPFFAANYPSAQVQKKKNNEIVSYKELCFF